MSDLHETLMEIARAGVPKPMGTCPVCSGSKRQPYTGEHRYANIIAGYDPVTDTVRCQNCGGQYMYGTPLGRVFLRPDGTPCKHKYRDISTSEQKTRCIHESICEYCGDNYYIDSGD